MARIGTIEIAKLVRDDELYPRTSTDWMTAYKYAEAMKLGAKFPAVIVGIFNGKYYLVDGWHRVMAVEKTLKGKKIPAKLIHYTSIVDMYKDAIAYNNAHGRQLSQQDRAMIAQRLKEYKVSAKEISQLVGIAKSQLNQFVSSRIAVMRTDGSNVPLKAPIRSIFSGKDIGEDVSGTQHVYASNSQMQIVNELITLIETDALDLSNKKFVEKFAYLKRLMRKIKV